jgi:glutaryl-CoA dehydrogenase
MEDFLLLDELYSDEERLLRDSVRKYVDEKVISKMPEAYEQAHFPREFIQQCAELGLFGVTLPQAYGGAEASYTAYGLLCQELERGDSGLRSLISVQSSLCMYPIFRYGSEAQKQKFLPSMAQGKCIGCFGLTEPDFGSNPAGMRTTAKKVDKGWLLNGSKMWITNASIADIAIVWAKTENGIRGFIVEKDFPGFSQQEIHQKMSLRASVTGGLAFEDCFIPDDNYLPGSDKGLGAPLSCLNQARFGIAWGAIGAAMACFDIAVEYLKSRQQFAKPLAAHQLIQKDLSDMFTEIVKAQAFNYRLARLKDDNRATAEMISIGKRNSCRTAIDVARQARNLLGGNGISLEYHVIRHMTNLESVITYEGTENIHHLILGRHLTDINAFES